MKIDTQTSAEKAHLAELIAPMSVAMLTTVDAEGALQSRPMAPLALDGQGALWFFTDLRSVKVDQLQRANLCFVDMVNASYVSMAGHGELSTDRAHIEALWTSLARPWFPDGPESTNLALLKFVPDTAEYWDAPHTRMVRMLATAASVIAGAPIALGEHATLHDLSATPSITSS